MFDLANPKLATLAALEGYEDPMDLIEDKALDSICPAICMTPGCDATTDYEPDQRAGWCETCGTGSMKSALVIAGMI